MFSHIPRLLFVFSSMREKAISLKRRGNDLLFRPESELSSRLQPCRFPPCDRAKAKRRRIAEKRRAKKPLLSKERLGWNS